MPPMRSFLAALMVAAAAPALADEAEEAPTSLDTLDDTASTLDTLEPRAPEDKGKQAQTGSALVGPAGLLFASFDADHDYLITEEEIAAGMALSFVAADKDGGASVSPIEYASWAQMALGARDALPSFLRLDKDFNGSLSETEMIDGYQAQASLYRADDSPISFADLLQPLGRAVDPSRDGPLRSFENARSNRRGPGEGRF